MNGGKYLEYYGADNSKELRRVSDLIISKYFGWLPQMYHDDFYSIAGEVLWSCNVQFDDSKGAQFETYLINCLVNKFKTRITYMNRKRRNNGSSEVSLEKIIDDENGTTVGEMIADKPPVEISDTTQQYLNNLTRLQRRVAEMIMEGFDTLSIKKELHLSNRRFRSVFQRMKTREKTAIFDEGDDRCEG